MKKYIIKTLLLSLLVLVGCNEKYADYTAPGEINDTSWIIGFDQNKSAENAYLINIDTYISFLDLSQGYIDHEWQIEEGNKFLEEGFTKNDSLPLFIKNDEITTSDEKAHVFFRKKGLNTVRLYNTFSSPVTRETSLGTYTSKKVGDLYVVDTTFTFDVFGYIEPAFRILQDGVVKLEVSAEDMPSLDNEAEWPVVEVKAATSLTYEDLTVEGRPNSRKWNIPDGTPATSNGESAIIKFFRLGTYNAGTITSNRFGSFPTASAEKIIPLKVKVIQSDLPFEINGQIKEAEDEVLSFQVTGEIEDFTGQESFFTVNVKNEGFDQNIAVSQAKRSDSDGTYIELKLSESIYNSDVITVNYSGGSIQSTDERILADFTAPITVVPHFGNNVLPGNGWASFETPNGAINNAFAQDYFIGNVNKIDGSDTEGYYMRDTSKSYLGDASMKFESTDANPLPSINLWGFAFSKPDPIKAGTYKMSYRVWLEEGNTLKAIRTEINKPNFLQQVWDIENTPRGSWQLITNTLVLPDDVTETNSRWAFRVHPQLNVGVTGAQKMYIDDFSLIEIEERP
ncbi:hypothetical protein SAMN05216503_0532 [Polaribacter sp. KT25b]|uniref:hypothetical protein n=1 Tax=Polaribacter sp. KT25b TaxID=1855336 RepID=UPI0008793D64|nr:hypothetical protein [Polaribacter sp. KT25b]SDR70702.1 hypothetical protein SAMN05216503_0532 [Polaribacter sp. KT25b]